MKFRQTKTFFIRALFIALGGFSTWAYWPMTKDPSLTFKWEGAVPSKINFRDAGESINSCLGQNALSPGRLLRSSHFYSGWSCSAVGNPDVIYSLDTYLDDGRKFYCRAEEGLRVGKSFQTTELRDLEFLETWSKHPEFVAAACKNIRGALKDLSEDKKVLVQCEAGRDRTGAITALLGAYLLEQKFGKLDDSMILALECDYRKSKSIKQYKYGRIENFIREVLTTYGSVTSFIEVTCAL